MKPADKFDFGASLKELEAITAWFESENIDLDEGLAKFERGMELVTQLKARLNETQNRVDKIKVQFEKGEAAPSELPPNDQLF